MWHCRCGCGCSFPLVSLLSRMAVRSPGKRPNNPLLRRQASEGGSKYGAGEGDRKGGWLIKGGSALLFELCLSGCRVFIHETHFLGLGMSRSNQKLGVTLALIKMLGLEVISVNHSRAFPGSSRVTSNSASRCPVFGPGAQFNMVHDSCPRALSVISGYIFSGLLKYRSLHKKTVSLCCE